MSSFLEEVRFNDQGLIPVIVIDDANGQVLMHAWMNEVSLRQTVEYGEMVYYSRSRQKLWHKGETSGHTQSVIGLWLDCDGDTLLARVQQKGGIACHTGRHSCFYRKLDKGQWLQDAPVIKSAKEIYGN